MTALIENFHFLRPLWLLAALPALGLFFICWKTQNQASEWQSEIAPHLLPWLVEGTQSASSKLPWYGLLLLWLVTVIALAGPTWEKLPQPLMKDSSALVVAFDLSPSMNVKDLTPSRVMRARLKLIDLLDTRKEGLTALIAYAGEAHVVTPLTDDVETIKNMVPSLAPQTMPVPGSNTEMALEMANRLLKDAGIARGNIVFITDGIAPAALAELKKLRNNGGHHVAVWGFGTQAGAPIQLPDGGFARNKNGEIVVAKLDEEQLSDAAVELGGLYVPFTDTAEDIDTIRSFSIDPFNKQQREVEREFDQWAELGPWLVLLCLPLVALSFRRGLILSFLLVVGFQPLTEVHAQEQKPQQQQAKNESGVWDELWLTRNQRAQRALDAGDAETAANLFEQPQRKGTANFRAQNFEEAAEFFKQSESSADSWFNQGTALTHAGKYDEALAAYNKALELQPEYPEARNNMEITKKLREFEKQQQQQQQNNQQNQDQQQSQDQQSQDSQDQQSSNQNQQQDQNQEQQNQQQDGQQNDQQNAEQQQAEQENSQSDSQQEDQQQAEDQARQQAESEVDEERAQQNFEKQLAEAQKQQEQHQEQPEEHATQQAQQMEEKEQQQEAQQEVYLDPEQLAASEDQQKLEQLLRRVPDDPGRLLRNKFRYEAQQRRMEANPETWNTLENAEEERW